MMARQRESKTETSEETIETHERRPDLLDQVLAETARRASQPLEVDELIAQRKRIEDVMKQVMKDNVHYGVIPGTQKPTLLQPGAQLLCNVFRMEPRIGEKRVTDEGDDHRTVTMIITLYQIGTGLRLGDGVGVCTSMESRYRYRQGKRKCPLCDKEAVIKGSEEYGGGWLCWKKKDGCGAKFEDNDPKITGQTIGQIENDDPADCWNTVEKICFKRGMIAAVLNVLACSDHFTQDMEDVNANEEARAEAKGGRKKAAGTKKDEGQSKPGRKETMDMFIVKLKACQSVELLDSFWATNKAGALAVDDDHAKRGQAAYDNRRAELATPAKSIVDETAEAVALVTATQTPDQLAETMKNLDGYQARLKAAKDKSCSLVFTKAHDAAVERCCNNAAKANMEKAAQEGEPEIKWN